LNDITLKLVELDLSWNKLGDESAELIAQLLEGYPLQNLKIENTDIGFFGVARIAEAAKISWSIEEIVMPKVMEKENKLLTRAQGMPRAGPQAPDKFSGGGPVMPRGGGKGARESSPSKKRQNNAASRANEFAMRQGEERRMQSKALDNAAGPTEDLWRRTALAETLAKAGQLAYREENTRIKDLRYMLETEGTLELPGGVPDYDVTGRRLNRKEKLALEKDLPPFEVPAGGDVILRCSEGDITCHEEVLCSASEKFGVLMNSLLSAPDSEPVDPTIYVGKLQQGTCTSNLCYIVLKSI